MTKPIALPLLFVLPAGLAAAQDARPAASLSDLRSLGVVSLDGPTHHVQGVEVDGGRVWVTSVDAPNRKGYLFEFSLSTGRRVRTIALEDGGRFHPGGFASSGDSLWIPVAEYRRNSTSVIQKRGKKKPRSGVRIPG